MADYDNNLTGVLFKNDKEGIEARPDYTGKCEIDGREFWLSAWIKTPKKGGDKFMSLSFQEKEDKENTDQYASNTKDDTPF